VLQNTLKTNYGRSLFMDTTSTSSPCAAAAAAATTEDFNEGEGSEGGGEAVDEGEDGDEYDDEDDDNSTRNHEIIKALHQLRQVFDRPILSANHSSSSSSSNSLPMYSVKAVSDRLGISGVGACLPVWELSNPKYR
jgi:hypothetical protein